jgi:hypothetical protein
LISLEFKFRDLNEKLEGYYEKIVEELANQEYEVE